MNPEIKFVRVVRDCPHNDQIKKENAQATGRKEYPIYDYEVVINGETRAILKQWMNRRSFRLETPDNDDIVERATMGYTEIIGRENWEPTIRRYLELGHIPTLKGLAQRRLDKAQAEASAANLARRNKEKAEWEARLVQHGPELLKMIERLRLTINPLLTELRDGNESLRAKAIKIQKEARTLWEKLL